MSFMGKSSNVSVNNFLTSKRTSCSNRINAAFDLILTDKKEALADMDYLDDHIDHSNEFEEEDDTITFYSDKDIQQINSNIFIVPCRSETSSYSESTGF